jgi:hypothetical protein
MADNWDDRMQEHFDKLQAALSAEFSNQLTTQLATIRAEFATQHTALKTELSAQHAATKTELAAQLEATSSQLEKRLEKGLEARLGQRISVQAEELREIVRTAAGNYGGVLGGLQREIAEFRDEWRKNAEVTNKALTNHLERIVVLEQVTGVPRE